MKPNQLPIDVILSEIERALDARLFYGAIAMALTVPDICAALGAENGRTTRSKYKAWYKANLSAKYPSITEDDCYSLRCGVVHQGRFGNHEHLQYARVIFTMPDGRRNIYHGNILNDALNLDAVQFCLDVINAARQWYRANQNNPIVQSNLPNLVQFRPNGLNPYIFGIPVIA